MNNTISKNLALHGLKVVGFVTEGVGPLLTKNLAINGATVVLVESANRPDGTRLRSPFKDNITGVNRSYRFAAASSDKYDICINLKQERAKEVTKKLIDWADVIVENFRPGVLDKFQLGYKDVSAINPKIIMISLSAQGQTGPYCKTAAYGPHLAGYCGFSGLTGWPDRGPVTIGPYTDLIIPVFGTTALLAALDYRSRTGKGQYIDISQFEVSSQFLASAILDYTANGIVQTRNGNKSSCAVPNGVYKCKGNDKWCAISIFTDEEWANLCKAIGSPAWTSEKRFNTIKGRKDHEDELDKLIEEWTTVHDDEEVMMLLQHNGVCAGVVRNTGDVVEKCPQLAHRYLWRKQEHPEVGETIVMGSPYIMSETPYQIQRPAPGLGEHTEYICSQFLNMSDEEFISLEMAGVFK